MRQKNEKELVENGGKKLDRKTVGSALSLFCMWYMRLVLQTGFYELKNKELLTDDTMLGFWHGDSYCMQFVLRDIIRDHKNLKVIVTANRRGDYIEQMIRYNGGVALRLPDGLEMRSMFKEVLQEAGKPGQIIGVALDGPAGPHEDPKKLIFLLASIAKKKVVCVHFRFHRVWRVKQRWDNYRIPLPFGRITAEFQEIGEIDSERLREFEQIKKEIEKTV